MTRVEADAMKTEWRETLSREFDAALSFKPNKADWLDGHWAGLKPGYQSSDDERRGKTGAPLETPVSYTHLGRNRTSTAAPTTTGAPYCRC